MPLLSMYKHYFAASIKPEIVSVTQAITLASYQKLKRVAMDSKGLFALIESDTDHVTHGTARTLIVIVKEYRPELYAKGKVLNGFAWNEKYFKVYIKD